MENKKSIHLGERNIELCFGVKVNFDCNSTISFYNDADQEITIDPTDLSVVYAAYMQMRKELNGDV